jgi:hypothetical protein
MQLLSALDQIIGPLWAALFLSAALVAVGVALHVTGALVRRVCAGISARRALRDWLRKVFEAGILRH